MTRPDRAGELEAFKRQVNLTELAAGHGYALDRRASSRNSVVMVHPAGDKLVVAKGEDGHWVYFSVRDPADHGSVVDFLQRRRGGTLGEVRKALRRWAGGAPVPHRPSPSAFVADLEHIPRDLAGVRARWEAMRPAEGRHRYLEDVRRLPAAVLVDPAFADRVRADDRGNAAFPHYNRAGLCGYELKNRGFTGFASGGVKGLWVSRGDPAGDHRLVVAETAIDALSYAALDGAGRPATRYASTGGELNPDQPGLVTAAVTRLARGGVVVLAVDHDAGGARIAGRLREAVAAANRPDLAVLDGRPPVPGQDWNDVLRLAAGPPPIRGLRPPSP